MVAILEFEDSGLTESLYGHDEHVVVFRLWNNWKRSSAECRDNFGDTVVVPCGEHNATGIVRLNLPDQFRYVSRFCLVDLKSQAIGKGSYRRLGADVLRSIDGSNSGLAQHMDQSLRPLLPGGAQSWVGILGLDVLLRVADEYHGGDRLIAQKVPDCYETCHQARGN